jgi:hypothetical protein
MAATVRILPLESCPDPSLINKEVEILKVAAASSKEPSGQMAIVSHDEKPGVQAIGATAPVLPPTIRCACRLCQRSRVQAPWRAEPWDN